MQNHNNPPNSIENNATGTSSQAEVQQPPQQAEKVQYLKPIAAFTMGLLAFLASLFVVYIEITDDIQDHPYIAATVLIGAFISLIVSNFELLVSNGKSKFSRYGLLLSITSIVLVILSFIWAFFLMLFLLLMLPFL